MDPRKQKPKAGGKAAKSGKARPSRTTKAKAAPTQKAARNPRTKQSPPAPTRVLRPRKAGCAAAPVRDEPNSELDGEGQGPALPAPGAGGLDEGFLGADDTGAADQQDEDSDRPERRTRRQAIKRKRDVGSSEPEDDDGLGIEKTSERAPPKKKSKPGKSRARAELSAPEDPDLMNWSEVEVLAEVDCEVTFGFGKGKSITERRMRVNLQVHKDPNKFGSRLGYRARLTLLPSARAEGETLVGYVHGWRIDKPTQTFPNKRLRDVWRQELLKTGRKTTVIEETSLCMRALYSDDGEVRDVVSKGTAELQNSLLFVQLIYILPEFQKKGLLPATLAGYHGVLASPPEWYAFTGTVVLVPARPEGSRGNVWGKMSDKEVENVLIKAYNKHGGYEVWARDANVILQRGEETELTVMGRTVLAESKVVEVDEDADGEGTE